SPSARRPAAIGVAADLASIARDCIEDIGALGLLRTVRGEGAWHAGIGRFESRLLACLDALAALGRPDGGEHLDIVAAIELHTRGRAVVDPMRVFAHAFTMACLDGEHT